MDVPAPTLTALGCTQRATPSPRVMGGGCRRSRLLRTDLVELLAVTGDGVGEVDDVEDLGAAEASDLHGSHARRLGPHPPTAERSRAPPSQARKGPSRCRTIRCTVLVVCPRVLGTTPGVDTVDVTGTDSPPAHEPSPRGLRRALVAARSRYGHGALPAPVTSASCPSPSPPAPSDRAPGRHRPRTVDPPELAPAPSTPPPGGARAHHGQGLRRHVRDRATDADHRRASGHRPARRTHRHQVRRHLAAARRGRVDANDR